MYKIIPLFIDLGIIITFILYINYDANQFY